MIAYATLMVQKGDKLPLWLAPGGVAAIRLHPGKQAHRCCWRLLVISHTYAC